jgi:endoglucanase
MNVVLQRLVACHSTPGDEEEVRSALEAYWLASGWHIERLGAYALAARSPRAKPRCPVLLICAHMDSPGFAVDRLQRPGDAEPGRACLGVTELGAPSDIGKKAVSACLKTRRGRFQGLLYARPLEDGETDWRFDFDQADAARADVRAGDRVCFSPAAPVCEGSLVKAPFLDNRLGCALLVRLADEVRSWRSPYEIVLGATASEEMCGFGARVLAEQVKPDAVIALDATYESEPQGVRLGGGPVLTLSDASVLISPALRDRVLETAAAAGVTLQTEVYNFSGTDARAFPSSGLAAPVFPLLLPTRGNHGPLETADLRDWEAWPQAVRAVAERLWE